MLVIYSYSVVQRHFEDDILSQSLDWCEKNWSFQPMAWLVLETKSICNRGDLMRM